MAYCELDTQTLIGGIDNRFCREIEKSFRADKVYPNTLYLDITGPPIRKIVLLSYPQSGVNALHIVIALKNVKLVRNKKLVPVEMFDFAVTQVDNLCKNELITVLFKVFDRKDTSLVFFNPKR